MKLRSIGSAIASAIALAAVFACFGGSMASAQKFQYTYGGDQPEAGRGGVRAVSEGGYITVGESFTPSGGATSDIYLVRTNGDGSLAWSQTYDIGGNDSATDIEEVPSKAGGYIITGVTENAEPLGCGTNRDVFLLRVDGCGKVMWVDTYGTPETDEIGYDVIVMQKPDEKCKGLAGDFVVAGSTCLRDQRRDGYMLRVRDQAPGNLVWARTYNSPCDGDDYWYGVTEAITGADFGQPGDLVVVGGSNGYCNAGSGGYDAIIAHLDGCGRNPGAFPYGVAAHGGKYDDDLRSVVELTEGKFRGTFVATGRTEVLNDAGAPQPEAYVLQTRAFPCVRVADLTIGDNHTEKDEGYCIREVIAPHPDAGDVVITGYMTLRDGFGDKDVFIQRLVPGNLTPVAPVTRLYGGGRDDWGWSVDPVLATDDGCFSDGYVIAGFTSSFDDSQQLYLIRTDANLNSGCNEMDVKAATTTPKYHGDCEDPKIEDRGKECAPRIRPQCQFWQNQLCYDADGTQECRAPRCFCDEEGLQKSLTGTTIEFDGAGSVSTYPNPIARGSVLNLEYSLTTAATASVTVSDMSGRTVYTHAGAYNAGTSLVPVNTAGWSAGGYIVNVAIGSRSESRRIIVLDK